MRSTTLMSLMGWWMSTRLLLWCLALSTSLVSPPYDRSASLLLCPNRPLPLAGPIETERGVEHSSLMLESSCHPSSVVRWMSPLVRWDSLHLLTIAQHGYLHQKQHAFYPFLPFVIHRLSLLLQAALGHEYRLEALLLSAFIINLLAMFSSVVLLYWLCRQEHSTVYGRYNTKADAELRHSTRDGVRDTDLQKLSHQPTDQRAERATVCFIMSAASVHINALGYTESIYTCFVLLGALFLKKDSNLANSNTYPVHTSFWCWSCCACWVVACGLRSNGITLLVILVLHHISLVDKTLLSKLKRTNPLSLSTMQRASICHAFMLRLCVIALQSFLLYAPSALYALISARAYCSDEGFLDLPHGGTYDWTRQIFLLPQIIRTIAHLCSWHIASTAPSWCSTWPMPSLYAHVQQVHWNVGLFRYYTFAQLPQFALAAPVLLMSLLILYRSAQSAYRRRDWLMLQTLSENPQAMPSSLKKKTEVSFVGNEALLSCVELKYIAHLLVNVTICVTILHVQVSTRFLVACPALYFHLAGISGSSRRADKMIMRVWLSYSLLYMIVGTCMFTAFLPWT